MEDNEKQVETVQEEAVEESHEEPKETDWKGEARKWEAGAKESSTGLDGRVLDLDR